jgi:hypothetical protein
VIYFQKFNRQSLADDGADFGVTNSVGVADAADVKILKEAANTTSKYFNKIQKSFDTMASYSHLTHRKLDVIDSGGSRICWWGGG